MVKEGLAYPIIVQQDEACCSYCIRPRIFYYILFAMPGAEHALCTVGIYFLVRVLITDR